MQLLQQIKEILSNHFISQNEDGTIKATLSLDDGEVQILIDNTFQVVENAYGEIDHTYYESFGVSVHENFQFHKPKHWISNAVDKDFFVELNIDTFLTHEDLVELSMCTTCFDFIIFMIKHRKFLDENYGRFSFEHDWMYTGEYFIGLITPDMFPFVSSVFFHNGGKLILIPNSVELMIPYPIEFFGFKDSVVEGFKRICGI
ncbi:MAG: hypothetical protein ACRCXZ_02335 [Patescibacteria group bacterium]